MYLVKRRPKCSQVKCYSIHLIPEQQHESLEESAEVVVVIDSCVLIQFNVSKHLQQRHSERRRLVFMINMNIMACINVIRVTTPTCIPMIA